MLKKAALAVVEAISVLYAVFIKKAGLWQLIDLKNPAKVLSTLDFVQFKADLAALSEADRESLEADLKAALPAELSAVASAIDLVERGIDVVEDAIAFVKKGIADVLSLVADVKALFGIK